ncbi:MAG: M23 family metallopeptidase [bacterium]
MVSKEVLKRDLQLETLPRELFPGEVVLIRVRSHRGIVRMSASLGKQKILFFSAQDKDVWMGLAGLDLDIPPGEQTLTYRAEFPDGIESSGTMILKVQKKEYPEERITVDKKYVHLSSKDLKRYKQEQKILDAIFSVQNPDRLWDHGFAVPLDVQSGSRFGLRRIINGEPRNPHSGTDLKAGTGTEVRASNAGQVVFAGDLFFSGNTVILDHGFGLYTLYAHLNDMTVGKGAAVNKGEIIGHVGATGRVTGPHLHWGAKLNGARVDPFSLVMLPLLSGTPSGTVTSPEAQAPTDRGTDSPFLQGPGSDPGDESR